MGRKKKPLDEIMIPLNLSVPRRVNQVLVEYAVKESEKSGKKFEPKDIAYIAILLFLKGEGIEIEKDEANGVEP